MENLLWCEANEDFDMVYKFRIKNNSEENPKIYNVEITINELNDDELIKQTCECKACKQFKMPDCKHRVYCRELLTKGGINFRYEPKPKEPSIEGDKVSNIK